MTWEQQPTSGHVTFDRWHARRSTRAQLASGRRHWPGHGGIVAVMRATGIACSTIGRGLAELRPSPWSGRGILTAQIGAPEGLSRDDQCPGVPIYRSLKETQGLARVPRDGRAAKKGDELAPFHVLPLVRGSDPTTSL
jgi:hypothetical protein